MGLLPHLDLQGGVFLGATWGSIQSEMKIGTWNSSPITVQVIKSRRMRWAGHVARIGEERGVNRVLVGKPEGRRPLGRPRHRWVDNIRLDLWGEGGV